MVNKLPAKEQVTKDIEREFDAALRLFRSPDGVLARKFLEKKFLKPYSVNTSPDISHAMSAQRAIIDYIKQLQEEK